MGSYFHRIDKTLDLAVADQFEESENGVIWEIDFPSRRVFLSQGLLDLLGYETAQIGSKFKDALNCIHPNFRKALLIQLISSLEEKRQLNIQTLLIKKGGEALHVVIYAYILYDEDNIIKIKGSVHDIFSFPLLQDRLHKFQSKFECLIEHSDGIFWEADASTFAFTYISPQVEKILGYTADEWLSSPGFWQGHIHPEEVNQVVSYCHSETQDLRDHNFDYRMKTKQGNYIWLNDRVKVHAKDNKPYKLTGLMVDVTKERQIREDLEQESFLVKQLLKHLPAAFFLFDEEGNILLYNDSLLAYSEYQAEEILTLKPEDFFVGEDRRRVNNAIARGFSTGEATLEANFQSKSGKSTPHFFRAAKIEYKGKTCLIGSGLDVSSLKGLESELRQSERRFKALIQDGSDMIAILDVAGVYQYVSASSAAILNIKPQEFLGKSAFDYIFEGDLDRVKASFLALKDSHRIRLDPFRFKDSRGKWRWMETNLTNLTHDPSVKGFVANSRDITDDYYKGKIESLEKEMLALVLDKDMKLVDILNAYLHSLETIFPKMKSFVAVVKNEKLHGLVGPRLSEEFLASLQQIPIGPNRGTCGTAAFLKERVIVKNVYEDERWAAIRHLPDKFGFKACWSQPIFNSIGKVTATFSSYYEEEREPDQHETYAIDRAEILLSLLFSKFDYLDALERSNERFEIASRATNDAIWDYEVLEDKLFWGPGFQTLFGYDSNIVKPTFEFLVSLIHPEDRETLLTEIHENMNGGNSTNIWSKEYRFLKSDGSYAHVSDKAIFIKDSDGKVVRALGAMSDISQRKAYEQSLRNLNRELQKNIKELAISNEELEQFAYVASHDLQEPLRMVDSFMGLLDKKYKEHLDDKARQYIFYASDGAKRMRRIINDLLNYSRVGRISGSLETMNVKEVLEDVLALFRNSIATNTATIQIGHLPYIHSYKVPVQQIFQNLISNAFKYSKKDEPLIIEIGGSESESHWEFWVKDNGIGIAQEYHDKIFVIFQRLHPANSYDGTGIGLAIIKKIINNMGGRIWLTSQEGEGSTFYFTICKP
ncbi:PAS domain-containing protein [Pleomorphovibrio marinus]|uniref:PAS domain-containing protein n=1 Tax=Pleomorphovibrio marinus TaxID=2164132 RepID=UPI000E0A6045|nr:PAS domain-containing protein [Pleomorphovibrio marinus]